MKQLIIITIMIVAAATTFGNSNSQGLETFQIDNGEDPKDKRNVNKSEVVYRVFLGNYKESIPIKIFKVYIEIGQIKPVVQTDGSTSYYSRDFKRRSERNKAMRIYKEEHGLTNVFGVVEYEDKFYNANSWKSFLNGK